MGEAVLVNRKKFVSSLANELVEPFNELSKKTRLTKTKLLDEAIEDLFGEIRGKGTSDDWGNRAISPVFPVFSPCASRGRCVRVAKSVYMNSGGISCQH